MEALLTEPLTRREALVGPLTVASAAASTVGGAANAGFGGPAAADHSRLPQDLPVILLNEPASPLDSNSAAATPLTFVILAPLATV